MIVAAALRKLPGLPARLTPPPTIRTVVTDLSLKRSWGDGRLLGKIHDGAWLPVSEHFTATRLQGPERDTGPLTILIHGGGVTSERSALTLAAELDKHNLAGPTYLLRWPVLDVRAEAIKGGVRGLLTGKGFRAGAQERGFDCAANLKALAAESAGELAQAVATLLKLEGAQRPVRIAAYSAGAHLVTSALERAPLSPKLDQVVLLGGFTPHRASRRMLEHLGRASLVNVFSRVDDKIGLGPERFGTQAGATSLYAPTAANRRASVVNLETRLNHGDYWRALPQVLQLATENAQAPALR